MAKLYYILIASIFTFVLSSCEKKDDSVIDSNFLNPVVSDIYLSTDTILTNSTSPTIQLVTSAKVTENGGAAIKSVSCKVFDAKGSLIGTFLMQDNGQIPDSIVGDGRYSANININNISCLIVGQYSIQYIAENTSGITSDLLTRTFNVIDTANQPPIISNPNLPDSVVRPSSGSFDLTISVDVTDPDGECDVALVYFDAFRPTGSYIGRNSMVKTGTIKYSFTAPVFPATADSSYGYYKYHFQAIDNSGALSPLVIDSIKFVRPNPN
ncbi:MAG: hypothetical protein ACP5P3_09250 [Ignavibacteria bacterium]